MNTPFFRRDTCALSPNPTANALPPVDHIEEVLRAAESKLQELLLQRAEIVKRIGAIKRTIVGVTKLCGDQALSQNVQQILRNNGAVKALGLTDSCRRVLMEASRPLSARAICAELEKRDGAVLAHHKDPVASVTTILNRLARYGEACAVMEGGRSAWRWASEAHEALLHESEAEPPPGCSTTQPRPGFSSARDPE